MRGDVEGDILVADVEELEHLDVSEIHARRLNAKEVLMPKTGAEFLFPFRRWNSQVGGKRSVFSGKSTQFRNAVHEERSTTVFFKETGLNHQTSKLMTQKRETISESFSGSHINRHHVQPRVKLYVPNEGSFPASLKYMDVVRPTSTTFNVLLDSQIDDER